MGPNGVGKSTLLRTIAGMQRPLKGTIKLGEENIHQLDTLKLARFLSVVLTDEKGTGRGCTSEQDQGKRERPGKELVNQHCEHRQQYQPDDYGCNQEHRWFFAKVIIDVIVCNQKPGDSNAGGKKWQDNYQHPYNQPDCE